MFFCTYQHYDYEEPHDYLNQIDIIECFICFEIKIIDEDNPIRLQEQPFYLRECECDSYVHRKCLKMWIDTNKNCPICRKMVREKSYTLRIIEKYVPYGTYIYLFIISIDINIFKILFVYLFLYIIIGIFLTQEIYINLQYKINNNNKNYYYDYYNISYIDK